MICSTRTRCWTPAKPRSRAWSRRARGWRRCWWSGRRLRFEAKLFNCAVVIYRGRVLGLAPKTYLPNYREYYEKRQFASSRDAVSREVLFLGERVPFGNDLIFEAGNVEGFKLHAEICEDVWTPIPPSTYAALAGATVLVNLSASNITIGKAEYRRNLCASQSGKCIAAYLYSCAGPGESTTDLAWDGHALIYENADLLAESERFADREQMITADIDLERLVQDRMRMTSFSDSVGDCRERLQAMRRIPFEFRVPEGKVALQRQVARFPYVPSDPRVRDQRCFEAYNIQVHSLLKRLASTGTKRVVIGISGGLDSTHALIVAAKTMDRMGLPRKNILAYTMPGFATSKLTLSNAHKLMKALGVTAGEIDIRPACKQMFRDIGHPVRRGEAGVRCDLRKRAGGRADLAPVPPGQPAQRAGAGHGRLERTGARLDDLRGRRPHVALQRELLGEQDAHPAPDPLGGVVRAVRPGDQRHARSDPGDGDFAGAGAPCGRRLGQARAEDRRQGRAV